jgi:hypothetical protein
MESHLRKSGRGIYMLMLRVITCGLTMHTVSVARFRN